ncbi:MAG: hypothetical protein IKD62_02140 [Oscillospiraceae bacterium]|nr:hypothetical protein [Oscillospiraceae bacterium]
MEFADFPQSVPAEALDLTFPVTAFAGSPESVIKMIGVSNGMKIRKIFKEIPVGHVFHQTRRLNLQTILTVVNRIIQPVFTFRMDSLSFQIRNYIHATDYCVGMQGGMESGTNAICVRSAVVIGVAVVVDIRRVRS